MLGEGEAGEGISVTEAEAEVSEVLVGEADEGISVTEAETEVSEGPLKPSVAT